MRSDLEIDITKATIYNKPFPSSKDGDCSAYIKAKDGKSYKLKFKCARSKEISQDWNGDLLWDQVDLIRSNPAILGVEEVNEAEQIYVDGLGSVNRRGDEIGNEDSKDHRFLDCQMGDLDPKHQLSNWKTFDKYKTEYWKREYPSYSPETDTSKKYPPSQSPVGEPGKWKPLAWRQELPDYAPKTLESKPKDVDKKFSKKSAEQSADPKGENNKMAVPASQVSHYELDLKKYGEKGFYDQEYPGLVPSPDFSKAEYITHYEGLYQQEEHAIPRKPKNVPIKFKYKIGMKKSYNDQWKLFVQSPMRLYKDFQVASEQKKVE